ncbi:MAG TPA: FG-GAP-like repeat-containing protein [Terracidiphilus sp.]|nr:FG-GAP-like repeat-containing protein [Terracidiphilus sp.]
MSSASGLGWSDARFTPHYPDRSPLADVIALVPPGSDEYITERYATEIESIFRHWGNALKGSFHQTAAIDRAIDPALQACLFDHPTETRVRSSHGIDVIRCQFESALQPFGKRFTASLQAWLSPAAKVQTADFEIYGIEEINNSPVTVRTRIRYDLVADRSDGRREERIGTWTVEWMRDASQGWLARRWQAGEETSCIANGPGFVDVTSSALGSAGSYKSQLLRGANHWRSLLDAAIGVDVYCNNGVSFGDFDNDGFDDFYICQPAGLPNRLYRNRGDGTFEDVTEKAGVGVLDNTACALFADFENRGLQDLLVVCGTGPVLFINNGDGTFRLKRDAFKFARPPQGTFTHAAIADYDRDGRLDIYFCLYMYYLGLDQYHYPVPYYDARNGPPNCAFHNEGNWSFVESTGPSGLDADNNRYSFACAWGDANGDGFPDLFVANDFGSSQLYRNNGDGTFTVVSREAHVESVGAGMSCCWCDYDNDGRQDIYVPSMWEAAGQRVSGQAQFHNGAPPNIRELYQRHARGNALYRNLGNGQFENTGQHAGVEMGRWSWCSDFWDIDHDGYSDLYVTNGYISGPDRDDVASFFWRQVVAKSPEDATPSLAYERGWNAINELVRSDRTWHGYARNVFFVNNRDGTFSEASGVVGLDFTEDGRCFALADIDHDGRLEVLLKNRDAPQLRVLHNAMTTIGASISFRLRGTKSNRDAIGAAVTVEANGLRQTKYLQAGAGFLAQHSKELFFGVGDATTSRAEIRWPSGLHQVFENLPSNHCFSIEEGASAVRPAPFLATTAYQHPSPPPEPEALPAASETWLIQPLKAPAFSLPDLQGTLHRLESLRGNSVLLVFWAGAAPLSVDLLHKLSQDHPGAAASRVNILAVNVDQPSGIDQARAIAQNEKFAFPVLFSTQDVGGIYNLIYRHLFDRRRDLPIPVSFLLNRDGMIVKVYQGAIDSDRLRSDTDSIPSAQEERMRRALPFPGVLVQDKFERNDFTYGVAMFQHGYLDQAEESFRQVISVKPINADAHYNLGTLSLRRHDLAGARQYLEETIKLQPNYSEAWNNLGMISAEEGDYEAAVRNFQQSLALRPNYAIALLNLGNVYRRQHVFDKAQDCLSRALSLLPDDPEINYSLGMLYAQQDQPKLASGYLQKALTLRPDYPEALNNLGIVFVHQQEFARAEEQFKTGIRVSPGFDQSYLNLARLYVFENNREQARRVLLDLLQVQPGNANARQALEMLQ